MKVLITGGAGFIGSHLVEALIDQGDSVRILDNLSTGTLHNLKSVQGSYELVQGDIRNTSDVQQALAGGLDVIYHLAAHISVADSMQNPAACLDINIAGTNIVLQEAAKAGVGKVILSSSAAVYGDQTVLPIPESATLNPLSPYGVSKQVDEILGGLYTRSFHLPVISLRYFNVYGPRQHPDSPYAAAIPTFIQKLLSRETLTVHGDGMQTRDFVYVSDIARANIAAANSPTADGTTINICSGFPVSINDLVHMLRQIIQDTKEPTYTTPRTGDIYQSYGDPSLAKKLLSFSVKQNLYTGLSKTIDWMRN